MAGENAGEDDSDAEDVAQRRRIVATLSDSVRAVPTAEVPASLCKAVLGLLPVTGLSVQVRGGGSGMSVVLCASDATAAHLTELQYTLGEGPAVESARLRAPVLAADLTQGADARRWPLFARQAVAAGAEAVFSVPLGTAVSHLGSLDMYRDGAGPLAQEELRCAMWAADAVLEIIMLFERQPSMDGAIDEWLDAAVIDHEDVYQAAGMIMVAMDISADEALSRLRARAFAQGQTATQVAHDIVNRRLDINGHE
ncbi:ANTAR domain-containing protein [Streptomyces sp. NPDC102467]|uniref:ANTAR domain-containing protein n=1 Tax=Streptomyces sp. NPDC102467 TaxID=3366179 RepID=UPI00382CD462